MHGFRVLDRVRSLGFRVYGVHFRALAKSCGVVGFAVLEYASKSDPGLGFRVQVVAVRTWRTPVRNQVQEALWS